MTRGLRTCVLGILMIVAACVLIAGCTTSPSTSAPTVAITSPQNGATVPGGNVTVTVQVQNFNVVAKQGQANVTGEGHIHYYMDVSPLPSTAGRPAVPADSNAVWSNVAATTYSFANVPAGQHTFSVQLANNDHSPVIPLVTDSVTVTVPAV